MYRTVLMMTGLMMTGLVLLATTTAALGQDRGPLPPFAPRTGPLFQGSYPNVPQDPIPDRQYIPSRSQADQLIRWGEVGKCVAARNRDASFSYVTAKRGSPQAAVAARQLDSAFASCLSGSGIVGKANKGYRRAAVADALGVRLKQS